VKRRIAWLVAVLRTGASPASLAASDDLVTYGELRRLRRARGDLMRAHPIQPGRARGWLLTLCTPTHEAQGQLL
jgi:hypothetical protein